MEKGTIMTKSGWNTNLLKRLRKPKEEFGDVRWLKKAIKELGWDKDE